MPSLYPPALFPGPISSFHLACLLALPRWYLPPGTACRGPGRAGGKQPPPAGRRRVLADRTLVAGGAGGSAQVSARSAVVFAGAGGGGWHRGLSSWGRSDWSRGSHHVGLWLQGTCSTSLALRQEPQQMEHEGQAGGTLQTRSGTRGSDLGRTSRASSTSRFPGSTRKTARDSCAGEPCSSARSRSRAPTTWGSKVSLWVGHSPGHGPHPTPHPIPPLPASSLPGHHQRRPPES